MRAAIKNSKFQATLQDSDCKTIEISQKTNRKALKILFQFLIFKTTLLAVTLDQLLRNFTLCF